MNRAWSTVAHCETNGTDLLPVARPEEKQESTHPLYQSFLDEILALDTAALAMPPTPLPCINASELSASVPLCSSTTHSSQMVLDQWQIASNAQQIVINTLDDPKNDDSSSVPSAIHRDSFAPLNFTPTFPLLLFSLTTQKQR